VITGKLKPTKTHKFIKLLNDKGILLRNYTQNIDTFERIIGIPSEKLVESHGTFASARCLRCGEVVKDIRDYWRQVADDLIPMCQECGLGVCRPDVGKS
jgi:NAD-dependent deacetylase sirtuin 2